MSVHDTQVALLAGSTVLAIIAALFGVAYAADRRVEQGQLCVLFILLSLICFTNFLN